ncbi:UNVERIFIED_CONTAM: hypothetical protein FKN15_024325 [Acipenser sinensis]
MTPPTMWGRSHDLPLLFYASQLHLTPLSKPEPTDPREPEAEPQSSFQPPQAPDELQSLYCDPPPPLPASSPRQAGCTHC